MSNFAESLKELIFDCNYDQKTLAISLGISASRITDYLKNEKLPTVENAIKMADFFHCSLDYLLGRTDDFEKKEYFSCPPFPQRLNELKIHFGCTDNSIYTAAKISRSVFYEWKRGRHLPSVKNLIKLAEYFDCSVDFILGREQ